MKRLLISKYLLPITTPPIPNGALILDDNTVIAIDSYTELKKDFPGLPEEDLSSYLILPGFINCHTHLELTPLKGRLKRTSSFADWIKQLIVQKSQLTSEKIIAGVEEAIDELRNSGVVAIGDISSEFCSHEVILRSGMSGRIYLEFIALNEDDIESRIKNIVKAIPQDIQQHDSIQYGISPHSPYTICDKGFNTITSVIKSGGYHSAIHVGESDEEREFFKSNSGKLYQMMNTFSPVDQRKNLSSPLTYLYSNHYLTEESMMIHLNVLQDHEIAIVKQYGLSVIHCPLSHDFFGHPPFKLKKLLSHGVNVALGSDSMASNDTLNFFEELRELKVKFAFLTSEEIINMVTINGARALKLGSQFGEIQIGQSCSLIGIPWQDKITDPYENIIENRASVLHI